MDKPDEWRDWIVAEARSFRYTPFHHQGRVKGVGVDCAGLLYQVYGPVFGPFKPFPKDYPADWWAHKDDDRYLDFILPYVEEVPKPIKGGFSMWRIGRNFAHSGIFTERGTYIHAWGVTGKGSVLESHPGFFSIGNAGKLRAVKHFDIGSIWLKPLP
jgi:cell wall-associated NlpC family hydrolase